MNWHDLLPPIIAKKQTMWELQQRLLWARRQGACIEDLARFSGRSKKSVYGHLQRAEMRARKPSYYRWAIRFVNPVEKYLNSDGSIAELAAWLDKKQLELHIESPDLLPGKGRSLLGEILSNG